MARHGNTWIVVADGARARFFAPSEIRKLVSVGTADMVAPQSRQRPRDLQERTDRAAATAPRAAACATRWSRRTTITSWKSTASPPVLLAQALDAACERKEFDRLILVAPRRSLGELRTLMSKRVQGSVRQEIPKDLTNETAAGLWKRLATRVRPSL